MSHAVMVLKAKGPQDVATIVQPEVTFWRSVFSRHTNFTWEDTDVAQATGSADYGQTVEFKLPRSGDLVTKCFLALQVDPLTLGTITKKTVNPDKESVTSTTADTAFPFSPYIWDFGRALIDYVELTIGGYQIERITGDMLHVWDRLTRPDNKSWVDNLSVHHGQSVKFDEKGNVIAYTDGKSKQYVYIPLDFTFTQDPGLSLPMIAMQYHEVRVKVKFQTADKMFAKNRHIGKGAVSAEAVTNINYEARPIVRRMLQEGKWGSALTQIVHTMGDRKIIDWLIANVEYSDQVTVTYATTGATVGTITINIATAAGSTFLTDLGTAYADFDGTDIVVWNILEHINQRWAPTIIDNNYATWGQNIYVVPFSLDPESWKPTGSINFSRLDDVKLTLSGMNKPLPGSIHVYARNFNVLTVSNGMAGKRYAS
eukprot:jgi/Mesvir1/6399/Mv06731-RA.1